MNVLRSILLTTTIMSIGLSFAQAGVVIGGTRVIFDGNKKEASISINNPDNTPILSSHGSKRLGGREGTFYYYPTVISTE
jgi:P pilus assembly chaperone PapD